MRSERIWRAPGRVNLIGEHIDYLGGLVLPFACDLEIRLVAEPQAGWVELSSTEVPGLVRMRPEDPGPGDGWGRYVSGVLRALNEGGYRPRGVRGVVTSAIPPGAGLSSSAALEAAVALAVLDGELPDPSVLQRAEHLAVGVPCGPMDQVAVVRGRAGRAVLLDCATGAWEHVPLPETLGFVVVDTGTRRSLDDGRYAGRRAEAERALAGRSLDEVTDPGGDRRLRHAVGEQRRVREAVAALRAGDLAALGRLVDASHDSLRDDYEVSAPALDEAVQRLRGRDGCLGARLLGAGFAGCVLGLVEAERAETVAASFERAWVVRAVDGAGPLTP